MKSHKKLHIIFQISLVVFTLLGYLLTAFKYPEYGLIASLVAQVFWLYSTYKSWKEANEPGEFIATVLITFIIIFGILNYFLIK